MIFGEDTRYQALSRMTRLAQRRPDSVSCLQGSYRRRLDALAEPSLDVAVDVGDPIGWVLADAVQNYAPEPLVEKLEDLYDTDYYRPSIPLREVGLIATKKLLELRYESLDSLDDDQFADAARLALNLGRHLSQLGYREEAAKTTQQAVQLYRPLAVNVRQTPPSDRTGIWRRSGRR